MKNNRLFIAILSLLIFVAFSSVPALAGYTVVPMQFTLNAKPGKTVSHTMKVENIGKGAVSVTVSLYDFIKGPDGEERQVKPGTVKRGLAGWIRVSPLRLDLEPGDTKSINFTMTVPMDSKGIYWGNILVSQVSKPTLKKTVSKGKTSFQIFALQDMLIRILEKVPGTAHKAGAITDMFLKDLKSGGRGTIQVVFENHGNSLLKADGKVEIRDEGGETVRKIPLEYGHSPFTVYPEGKRNVYARIKEKLPAGDYVILAIIDYGGEDLVAGQIAHEVK